MEKQAVHELKPESIDQCADRIESLLLAGTVCDLMNSETRRSIRRGGK